MSLTCAYVCACTPLHCAPPFSCSSCNTENESTKTRPALTLETPSDEVSKGGKRYSKRVLRINDAPVIVRTAPSYQAFGVKFIAQEGGMTSVVVPIDVKARQLMDGVENLVKEELPTTEVYKPLYRGENMCVTLSKFCKYYRDNHQALPPNTSLDAGTYQFTLYLSHVYFGPLKGGATCCITMQVNAITYDPLTLPPPTGATPLLVAAPEAEDKTPLVKRRGGKAKKKGLDEVDLKLKMPPRGGRIRGFYDEVDHPLGFKTANHHVRPKDVKKVTKKVEVESDARMEPELIIESGNAYMDLTNLVGTN